MVYELYGVGSEIVPGTSPSRSTSSFDFLHLLDPEESQILDESLSLDSLSTVSTDSIPPFPPGRTIPMSPILLDGHSPMFPRGRVDIIAIDQPTVTLTTPTSPRLAKMPTEGLCVRKWAENLETSDAPGHIPWGNGSFVKPTAWIPEGSMYPPDAFMKALSTARGRRQVNKTIPIRAPTMTTSTLVGGLETQKSPDCSSSSRRDLVFERQITRNTYGTIKRWSLQVPATTMNPEMVDMMLELQDLNSFFKDGLDDVNQSTIPPDQDMENPKPPSLIISDSHSAVPLCLESSENSIQDLPLAVRRGKLSLPPLNINQNTHRNAYPSIPTAFLGSPSAYSPKFEHANAPGDPSLGLEDMVNSLRSQCASILPYTLAPPRKETPTTTTTLVEDEDDDWAFADTFDKVVYRVPNVNTNVGSHRPARDVISGGNVGPVDTQPLVPERDIDSHPRTTKISTPFLSSPVPSTPLPQPPANTQSSSHEVRSILKSSKNVRFASLPDRRKASVDVETPDISSHHSTGSLVVAHLQRPTRLRAAYTVKSDELVVSSVPPRVGPIATSTPVRAPSRLPSSSISRPVSVPLHPDHFQTKGSKTNDPARPPQAFSRYSTSTPRQSTEKNIGRHSLKRGLKDEGGKENGSKGRTSFSPKAMTTSRWTMNEITFRRGSNASQLERDSPKSRMPVPLRNILTRFK